MEPVKLGLENGHQHDPQQQVQVQLAEKLPEIYQYPVGVGTVERFYYVCPKVQG
ncbi:MAG: hypothetical protein JXQ83_05270 [Candidatus Glassbacteria bacterium]|nr:hypothetical protein [Candidatus Glassbacteria bacterium]